MSLCTVRVIFSGVGTQIQSQFACGYTSPYTRGDDDVRGLR